MKKLITPESINRLYTYIKNVNIFKPFKVEEKSKSRSSKTETPRRESRRENESSQSSKRSNPEPIDKNEPIKRPRENRDKDLRTTNNGFSRFESADAEPLIAGANTIDQLGQPFGKELTGYGYSNHFLYTNPVFYR